MKFLKRWDLGMTGWRKIMGDDIDALNAALEIERLFIEQYKGQRKMYFN